MQKTKTQSFDLTITSIDTCQSIIKSLRKSLKKESSSIYKDIALFIASSAAGNISAVVGEMVFISQTNSGKRKDYLNAEIEVFEDAMAYIGKGAKSVTVTCSQTGTLDFRSHTYVYGPNVSKITKIEY